jgi:hypothetical protein
MLYRLKVALLKGPRIGLWWRYWRDWRGDTVGSYEQLSDHIREHAPGKSFADIGCMWGVNGAYSFLAEEMGAAPVKAVDVFGPTPEFEQESAARRSAVEFILGDATDEETIARIGMVDVVFCAGVLYHHPSPFDLLVALRRMCRRTLILRTSTIPEIHGLPNAAVFYPQLAARPRRLWNLARGGISGQVGIETPFQPEEGYGNWFWGLTPSCVRSMLETAGFNVARRLTESFSQTFICEPVDVPFVHRLPNKEGARELGRAVSESGSARPT